MNIYRKMNNNMKVIVKNLNEQKKREHIKANKLKNKTALCVKRSRPSAVGAAWSAEKNRGRAASSKHLLMYIIDEELRKVGREADA